MSASLSLVNLRRLLRPAALDGTGEHCQHCGAHLPAEHGHVADLGSRRLRCVCAGCHRALLLGNQDADEQRAVPRRYLRLPSAVMGQEEWDACDIPVGIAFFFHNSLLGRTVASYPSPAGATESLLPPEAWERVLRSTPWTRTLAPDVEALLVRRDRGANQCFIVPIDACYELVGRVRRRRSGFGGGAEVQEEIESFFGELVERSEEAPL